MAKRHRWADSYRDDEWQRQCIDCGALRALWRWKHRHADGMYLLPGDVLSKTAGPCEPKTEKEADSG